MVRTIRRERLKLGTVLQGAATRLATMIPFLAAGKCHWRLGTANEILTRRSTGINHASRKCLLEFLDAVGFAAASSLRALIIL